MVEAYTKNGKLRPVHLLLVVSLAALAWSVYRPRDYGVWLFEILPGILGVGLLVATERRFRFSGLVYLLVGIHFAILAAGGKYTYAEMPLFNWLRDALGLSRNYYDRVGHFAQGFFPAIIAREILLRASPLRPGKWLFFLTVCVCLALSAFWEMIEWWVVLIFYSDQGQEWLGSQGDVWDAQSDMLMALLGSILSQLLLAGVHQRSLSKTANIVHGLHE